MFLVLPKICLKQMLQYVYSMETILVAKPFNNNSCMKIATCNTSKRAKECVKLNSPSHHGQRLDNLSKILTGLMR